MTKLTSNNNDLIDLTKVVMQLKKDFYLCGLDFEISSNTNMPLLKQELLNIVDYLLQNNSSDLYRFLYRVDINESELIELQIGLPNLIQEVVEMIIQRTSQKVIWRDKLS